MYGICWVLPWKARLQRKYEVKKKNAKDSNCWTGYFDNNYGNTNNLTDFNYQWMNSDISEYANWANNEPSQSGCCAVIFNNDGSWNDTNCDRLRYAICALCGNATNTMPLHTTQPPSFLCFCVCVCVWLLCDICFINLVCDFGLLRDVSMWMYCCFVLLCVWIYESTISNNDDTTTNSNS